MTEQDRPENSSSAADVLHMSSVCSLADFEYQQLRLHKRGRMHCISCAFSFGHGTEAGNAGLTSLLLMALLRSDAYQKLILDHAVLPWPGVHGPFSIDRLDVADYSPLAPEQARGQMAQVLAADKWRTPPAKPDRLRLAAEFVRRNTLRAEQAFYLEPCREFNATARGGANLHHEWSHALIEFHEYLFVNTAQGHCDVFCLAYE